MSTTRPSQRTLYGVRTLLLAATALLLHGVASAQSTGVTLVTGMPGAATDNPNVLRVALPVRNMGTTAADDLRITAVTLRNAVVVPPITVPLSLGTVAAGGSFQVQASFDRSAYAPGANALLTVSGNYLVGGTRYGFTLNRVVTVPRSAPGSAMLRAAFTTVRSIDPPRFPVPATMPIGMANPNPPGPVVPLSPPRVLMPVISNGTAVDTSGGRGPGTGAPTFSFGPSGRFGGVTGNPPDPNGASGGGVILTTVNTTAAISIDGGATFTNINPFCMFGYVTCNASGGWTAGGPFNVDGNLCCDQAVIYVPQIDRFVWLMQTWPNNWPDGNNRANPPGNNRVRMVVVSPQDVRNWATGAASSWLFFDLTTALFGMGANQWLDYPSIAVGPNFLYMSIDQVGTGLVVARMPLNQIVTAGTVLVEWTNPSDTSMAYGSHLMQNTNGVMYWAGHNGTNKLRVFDMPEAVNQYGWRDVEINSYSNTDYASNTPSGTNWLQGSSGWGLENVLGAVFRRPDVFSLPGTPPPPDELWFAWGAGRNAGAGRNQPYVEMVRLQSSDFALREQIHIWNSDFAFSYPALAVNDNKEIGMNLGVGGGTMEAVTVTGFLGDFVVYVPGASTCSRGRFGDWLGLRRSGNNGKLFAATGYRNTSAAGGACPYDPVYNEFGRFCDVNPNHSSCQIIIK